MTINQKLKKKDFLVLRKHSFTSQSTVSNSKLQLRFFYNNLH
jgi:hypothetical protein